MTTLSILIIGLFAGLLIAMLAGSTILLTYIAWRIHRDSQLSAAASRRAVNSSTMAIDRMRGEVALALSSMDANRLHDASLAIQHGVKSFQQTVATLSQLVFKAGVSDGNMGLDFATSTQPNYYDDSSLPPSPATNVPRNASDPFTEWRRRRNQEERMNRGPAEELLPVNHLPDIQHDDGQPLEPSMDDTYLEAMDDLPGMTDGNDAAPRP